MHQPQHKGMCLQCLIPPGSTCRQQFLYKSSAIAASLMFAGLAIFATYNRFFYHSGDYATFPWLEFWGTIAMIGGGVVRDCFFAGMFCLVHAGTFCDYAFATAVACKCWF
jgi:hypothetical protein